MGHDGYRIAALVGRAAVVSAVVDGLGGPRAVRIAPLRFGLAAAPLADALPAGPAAYVELLHLSPDVLALVHKAAELGPAAWIEAEWADGAGYHAALVVDRGQRPVGPLHAEGRDPVNQALAKLGVIAAAGKDELEACGLLGAFAGA